MKKIIHPRTVVLLLMICLAAAWRLFAPGRQLASLSLENFTPLGAMALFGGCYFANKWKAFLFPLLALFLSDIIIMQLIYPEHSKAFLYEGWPWVYGTFALIVFMGHFIKKVSVKSVFVSAASAALLHWVISDFGVWLSGIDITTGLPFTKDISGLLKCYILAIPYLKNILMGNLVFSALMFGSFELAQRRIPMLSKAALS